MKPKIIDMSIKFIAIIILLWYIIPKSCVSIEQKKANDFKKGDIKNTVAHRDCVFKYHKNTDSTKIRRIYSKRMKKVDTSEGSFWICICSTTFDSNGDTLSTNCK